MTKTLESKVRLTEGGRVVIPAKLREELGLHVGDELLLRVEEGELRFITRQQAVARAQETVRHYVQGGRDAWLGTKD